MRDLQDCAATEWQPERSKTKLAGWGQRLLAIQQPNGMWAGGVYGPKWTGTTYTMLLLRDIGIPGDNAQMAAGAAIIIDNLLDEAPGKRFDKRLGDMDDCISGMIFSIALRLP